MTKQFLGVTVDVQVIETIDEERGQVKRSTFVNDILQKALGLQQRRDKQ